jgi:hypothetical protein
MKPTPYDWTDDPGVTYPSADDLELAYRNAADWLTSYTAERVQTALQLERDRIDSELTELRESVEQVRRTMLRLATDQLRFNRIIGELFDTGLHSVGHDSPLRQGDAD